MIASLLPSRKAPSGDGSPGSSSPLSIYFFCRGLSVVPDEEVIDMYEGSHVPLEQMSDFYGKVRKVTGSPEAAIFLLWQFCGRENILGRKDLHLLWLLVLEILALGHPGLW